MKKKIALYGILSLYIASAIAIIISTSIKPKNKETSSGSNAISSLQSLGSADEIIGIVTIDTPISFVSDSSSVLQRQKKGAGHWLAQLNEAATNENIKAVIIRVNSPGGTVGASQELHGAVARIQKAGKPVITSVADLSASGGYYATVSSDRIFANPGSLIGSIGVILGGVEFSSLLEKVGIKYQAITSGKNKDILSPYKELSTEQRQFLQTMVNNTYNQFLTAVAAGRKKDIEVIRPLADGSVFTGEQAVENGLIDELGSFYDVIEYTKETYELQDATIQAISVKNPAFQFADLLNVFAPQQPQVNLIETTPQFGYSPVLYLYQF